MSFDNPQYPTYIQTKNIYSREGQLVNVLPKLPNSTNTIDYKQTVQHQREQTRKQFMQVKALLDSMLANPNTTRSMIIEGAPKNRNKSQKGDKNNHHLSLIDTAQKIERIKYDEIPTCGSIHTWSKILDQAEAKHTLRCTLSKTP